jgi:hypothetical protein
MPQVQPTDLFTGYEVKAAAGAVTADSIVIPKASLPALSNAEAEANGNGMEVLRAFVNASFTAIEALPAQDKPTKATIVKQPIKFLANGNYQVTYLLNFELRFDDNAAIMASE